MSHLALYTLGSPRIERDGVPVPIRRRRVIALLVHLAVTGRTHRRDSLATLFYPEHDQSQARARLRRTLSVLKTEVDTYEGYQVFPVPENIIDDQGTITAVGESFVWDQAAYQIDEFYPAAVAGLGDGFVFRGQTKQQVLFYPLSFIFNNQATLAILIMRGNPGRAGIFMTLHGLYTPQRKHKSTCTNDKICTGT